MKFKTIIAVFLGLSLAAAARAVPMEELPGASNNKFMRHRDLGHKLDRNTLRERVDETQALIDALARESRGLKADQTEPLFQSLREEYHLEKYVGKARKALTQAEEVLEVQEAVKAQEKLSAAAAASDQMAEDSKLLGLKSDLVGVVDALRDTLREIHSEASEDTGRDFRTWIMVSEGLLRNRREEAPSAGSGQVPVTSSEQSLSVSAETPLTYEGASPTAATEPVSVTVQAKTAEPAKKKKDAR